MIKRAKFLSKVGGVLLLFGSVLFFIAFAASGFSFKTISGLDATAKSEELPICDSITVNVDTSNVKIIFDDSAELITLKHEELTDSNGELIRKFNVSYENGKISVNEWESLKSELYLFDFHISQIELTIPSSLAVALNVTTDTGDVSLSGNGNLKKSSFETDTGDVVTTSAIIKSSESITFLTDTGDIYLGKLNTGAVLIETNTGDILLEEKITASTVSVKSDTGDIDAIADIITNALSVNIKNGDFESSAIIDAMEISASLWNGDIEVALIGESADYTVILNVHNGDANIQSGGNGARRLNVKSNSGDIEIKFRSR